MSNYYKYNFISPDKLYAKIQEDEMESYFSTGVIDTVLFPLWTEHCLEKFRKTFFPIRHTVLEVVDGRATLPCDFNGVREAWVCTTLTTESINTGSAVYEPQYGEIVSIHQNTTDDFGVTINTETYEYMNKRTREVYFTFQKSHMLSAGRVNKDPMNMGISPVIPCLDTYDVQDNELILSFYKGTVYLTYYSDGKDENASQLIPDEHFIKEYIEKYIIYRLWKKIFNNTTDETFNQVNLKYQMAKQDKDDAYVEACIEARKDTLDRKINRIKKSYNRHNRFNIR